MKNKNTRQETDVGEETKKRKHEKSVVVMKREIDVVY